MSGKKRIAVMCSGGGTNFQRLIDGCDSGEISGEIVLMISSAKKAYAIERAKNAGIPCKVLPKSGFASLEEAYMARHEALVEAAPDLIVLAGYLGVLPVETIRSFPGKIINTHPALIPAFCGKGMYGHFVHEAVIESGVKLSGATVHFADEGIDSGPIIMQESVPVLDDDTPETLSARILAVEYEILSRSVGLFCMDKLQISGKKVRIAQ